MKPDPRLLRVCAIAGCVAIATSLAARDLELPGLYYDEVIQAEPALAFLRDDPLPSDIPGVRDVRLLGRRLPWMTQPYMGALKSQALIPVFALLEPDATNLRAVTLVWALAGLVLAMIWAQRALGPAVALGTGALLAVDASFLYIARHDWGSFSLALLLRCAALVLLYDGHRARSPALGFAGGLCAGLGVYNKIDFAVWGIAAVAALVCAVPGVLKTAFGARRRETAAVVAGLALGAAPMLVAAGGAFAAAGAASRARADGSDWNEKLAAASATLDGSYFQRLMLAGGRFEVLPDVPGSASGPAPAALAVCSLLLLCLLGRERLRGRWCAPRPAQAFAVLCLVFSLAGLLLTPRAVRIHHYLNAWPFPQLVLSIALVEIWQRAAGGGGLRVGLRIGVATLAVGLLAGGVRGAQATHETLRETGGRGRWSDAAREFATSLPPAIRLVCLDWGFAGPLRFADPQREVAEPVWRLQRARGTPLAIDGTPDAVYLVQAPELAVFPFGGALLRAVAELPPDSASVTLHRDRGGREVFRSIRFARPHRLRFRGHRVAVELR
jgi:hypothetical protein